MNLSVWAILMFNTSSHYTLFNLWCVAIPVDNFEQPQTLRSSDKVEVGSHFWASTLLHDSHDTITPVGVTCLSNIWSNIQGPALGKITDVFSFSVACTVPSGTMEASQRHGNFLIGLRLISFCPGFNVLYVFSNRDLHVFEHEKSWCVFSLFFK